MRTAVQAAQVQGNTGALPASRLSKFLRAHFTSPVNFTARGRFAAHKCLASRQTRREARRVRRASGMTLPRRDRDPSDLIALADADRQPAAVLPLADRRSSTSAPSGPCRAQYMPLMRGTPRRPRPEPLRRAGGPLRCGGGRPVRYRPERHHQRAPAPEAPAYNAAYRAQAACMRGYRAGVQ